MKNASTKIEETCKKLAEDSIDETMSELFKDNHFSNLFEQQENLMDMLLAYVPKDQRRYITEKLSPIQDEMWYIMQSKLYHRGMRDGINLIKYLG